MPIDAWDTRLGEANEGRRSLKKQIGGLLERVSNADSQTLSKPTKQDRELERNKMGSTERRRNHRPSKGTTGKCNGIAI
jgi:hypothetical protein